MKILIWGSTGLVGSEIVKLALNDPHVSAIIAPVRQRTQTVAILKLEQIDVEFGHIPANQEWLKVDAVICALGTTMKKAKSKQAFRKVDYDYVLEAARLAKQNNVPSFVFNSAVGADPDSIFFYNQVKGEAEQDLQKLNFPSLTFCRPGLITGPRKEFRAGEEIGKIISTVIGPILPKKFKPNPAHIIAEKMLEAALKSKPGLQIISSAEMVVE